MDFDGEAEAREAYEIGKINRWAGTNESANSEYREDVINRGRSSGLDPWEKTEDSIKYGDFNSVESWISHKNTFGIKDIMPPDSINEIKKMDDLTKNITNVADRRAILINQTKSLRYILEKSNFFENLKSTVKESDSLSFKDFAIDRIMDGKKKNFIGLDDGSVGYRELVKGTDYYRDVPVISFEGGDIKILTKRGKPVETVVQAANVIGFEGKSLTTDYDAVVKAEKIARLAERQLDGENIPMQEIKNIEVNNNPGFLSGEMKETVLDISLHKKNIAEAEAFINGTSDVITEEQDPKMAELLKKLKIKDDVIRDQDKKLKESVNRKVVERELKERREIENAIKKNIFLEKQALSENVDKLREQIREREDAMTLSERIREKLAKGITIGALLSIIGLFITELASKISASTGGNKSSTKGESGGSEGSGGGDSPIIAAAKTILKNVGKFVAWLLKLIGKAFAFIGKYSILFLFFAVTAILGYIISRNKK